jgi:hypothetical protein
VVVLTFRQLRRTRDIYSSSLNGAICGCRYPSILFSTAVSDVPVSLEKPGGKNGEQTAERKKALVRYQQKEKAHQKELVVYNRNVFIIALVFALVFP